MSEIQDAVAPVRVVTIGGHNYRIAELGPGVIADFEAEIMAERVRALRRMRLSPSEFGETVAAMQRGGGSLSDTMRSVQSADGMRVFLWVILRKSNPRLTLKETGELFDNEPGALDDIMGALGMSKENEAGQEIDGFVPPLEAQA